MSRFEDDPYVASERRTRWWQVGLLTFAIFATAAVALLRHGRDRDREREWHAHQEARRYVGGGPWSGDRQSPVSSLSGTWRSMPGSGAPDGPSIEWDLVQRDDRAAITTPDLTIGDQAYVLHGRRTWTFSRPGLSFVYESLLRAAPTRTGVLLAAIRSLAEIEVVDELHSLDAWFADSEAAARTAWNVTEVERVELSLLGKPAVGRRLVGVDTRVELFAVPAKRGRHLLVTIVGAQDGADDRNLHDALTSLRLSARPPTPEFDLEGGRAPIPVRLDIPFTAGGVTALIARRPTVDAHRVRFQFEHPTSMVLFQGDESAKWVRLRKDDVEILITEAPQALTAEELAAELKGTVASLPDIDIGELRVGAVRVADHRDGSRLAVSFGRNGRAFLVTVTSPPEQEAAALALVGPVLRTLR